MAKATIAILLFVGLATASYSKVPVVDLNGSNFVYGYMERFIKMDASVAGQIYTSGYRIVIRIDQKQNWKESPLKLWYGTGEWYAMDGTLMKTYDTQLLVMDNMGALAYRLSFFRTGETFTAEKPLLTLSFIDEAWGGKEE